MQHFARPTPLADGDGAGDWFRMFGRWLLEAVPPDRHDELLARDRPARGAAAARPRRPLDRRLRAPALDRRRSLTRAAQRLRSG